MRKKRCSLRKCTGIERDEDHMVKHFLIDVDQVAFLGQQSASPKVASHTEPG
jgi:hypothetical protein